MSVTLDQLKELKRPEGTHAHVLNGEWLFISVWSAQAW
jgi:hypothetical protein